MITHEEMMKAWQAACVHARAIANGRLHNDDCNSEAGLAVAKALVADRFNPAKSSFMTFVKRLVTGQMFDLLERESRYEHMPDVWWGELLAAPSPVVEETDPRNPDAEQIAAAGASWRQIKAATGLSEWKSRELMRKHRRARDDARSKA